MVSRQDVMSKANMQSLRFFRIPLVFHLFFHFFHSISQSLQFKFSSYHLFLKPSLGGSNVFECICEGGRKQGEGGCMYTPCIIVRFLSCFLYPCIAFLSYRFSSSCFLPSLLLRQETDERYLLLFFEEKTSPQRISSFINVDSF